MGTLVTNGTGAVFPQVIPPLSNITPFTYRDGITYLELLYLLRDYVTETIVPGFDTEMSRIITDFNAGITAASADIAATKTGWDDKYAAFIANFTDEIKALNNAAVAGMVTDAGATRDNLVTLINTEIGAALNDAAVAAYVTGKGPTRGALDSIVTAAIDTERADVTAAMNAGDAGVRADLAAGLGKTLPLWKPGTDYTAGQQVINPDGDIVAAYENHRSGTVYTAANWYADHGYLFATFTYNSPEGQKLNLFNSRDGVTVAGHGPNPVYAPATGLRDPSVIRIGKQWFMVYGFNDPAQKKFAVATSPDLLNWNLLTTLDVSGVPGLTQVWAPELTRDSNGDVYIFFTSVQPVNMESWYVKASDSTLANWGGPVKLSWTVQPAKVMDPFFTKSGNTWYMFYGDNNYVCRATAPSLLGPWTSDKTGNWAGWGINKEGPQLVRLEPAKWRLYLDRYEGVSPNWTYPGYAYTESTDLLNWGPLTPLTMGPDAQGIVLRHGSFIKLEDKAAAGQVQQAMFSGAGAQNFIECTASTAVPGDGAETQVGTLTLDTERSLRTDGFTITGTPGRIKVEATGIYSAHFHAGDSNVNNFGANETTPHWVTIYCPTSGNRNLARSVAVGGYELSAGVPSYRLNAGDILEFRIAQFSGATKQIDSRMCVTRIK